MAAELAARCLSPLEILRVNLLSRTIPEENLRSWPWLAQVRSGYFRAIPPSVDWEDSHGLAYLIDGYELDGDRLWEDANARLARARETGVWSGTPLNLWISLFIEHRRDYFQGGAISPLERPLLDNLCRTLRQALI